MSNGISRQTFDEADSKTKDNMLIDMQFETHKAVIDLKEIVGPLKTDVKWLTWGFRLLTVSIIGLAVFILKTGVN